MSQHTPSTDATLETIDAGSLNNVCGGKKDDPGQKGVLGLDRKTGRAVGKAVGSAVGSVGGPVGRAAFGAAGGYIGSGDHGRDLGRDYQRNIANGADPYTG